VVIEKPLIKKEIATIAKQLHSLLGYGKFKDSREFFVSIYPDRIRTGHHQFIDNNITDIASTLLHIDFNDIFHSSQIFNFNDFGDDLLLSLTRLSHLLKVRVPYFCFSFRLSFATF